MLPGEADNNQQRMQLVVDFAENRPGVAPGGYLSDAQIHSVALALRLAAIEKFNGATPVVTLADVVISYDADHRRATRENVTDCRINLGTHDERVFKHLKDPARLERLAVHPHAPAGAQAGLRMDELC